MGGLRLQHWNARGLACKATYFKHLLSSQDIAVALVSETHLTAASRLRIPGYEVYRQHHVDTTGRAYSGLAVMVRRRIPHRLLPDVAVTECSALEMITLERIREIFSGESSFPDIPMEVSEVPQRSVDPLEFSSNLRSDLIYAQFRFEIDFILRQINKNLILIQNHICDFLHLKWTTLYPPDLPRKVAQYATFSPYSLGEFKDGLYKITFTIETKLLLSLRIPLNRKHGMFKVIDEHNNITLWVEPISKILYADPIWTHYSMVASWLPMINGTGIDPLTGKVINPKTANTPISLIEQAEEYYSKALYSQGSLAGIIEDNIYYNSPAFPAGDSSVSSSRWSGWFI
ncbi:unnamed protein product [Pieris macdunnoughi]|uniref:Uncharacterized protein n=1 Tax=Pieris macdunnoughi TaxID=345717 RepID=A0A821UG12_9NEOP|nr:unnamed protein product [Pieris macdunnoughi]